MRLEEKVERVLEVKGQFSLGVALRVLGLARSTWYYWRGVRRSYEERYGYLRKPLEEIARRHPEYGYRRVTVELRARGYRVNRKVIQRLQRMWDLSLLRGSRRPRPSGIRRAIEAAGSAIDRRPKGRARIGLFELLYTDFTELVYGAGRKKAYLVPMVDHRSKMAVGWAVGERPVTEVALQAWRLARRRLKGFGVSLSGVTVHRDQDPVFTGYRWTSELLLGDGVRLSYALNGAGDNPEMEAFNSRFKTENQALFTEARTLEELVEVVDQRFEYYNCERRHSAIGYAAPATYVRSLRLQRRQK